jgi:hypothetical protein
MTMTIRVGCHSATSALLNRTQLGRRGASCRARHAGNGLRYEPRVAHGEGREIRMAWVVVFGGGALVIACVAWFTATRRHPEKASGHAEDRPYVDGEGHGTSSPGVMDRPAGPDAENMSPEPPNRRRPRA